MSALLNAFFAWLPTSGMRVAVAGLFAIAIVFIVIRIVKLILEAIPFL